MSYHHLTREERGKLALLRQHGKGIREIARRLGRNASTISRELRRNSQENSRYRADPAQAKYELRRTRCKPKGKLANEELIGYIQTKLMETWSPEQVAGRLPIEYTGQRHMRVSYSSIYRWLHRNQLRQAAALQLNLRHRRHRCGEKRGRFHGVRELKERSKMALRRKRLGDWEVDTIVSSDKGPQQCLLSICDRKSRYCGLVLLKRKSASEVMRGFHFLFDSGALPLETVTADRGSEFACYAEVEDCWNIPFYFARPHSPWQKPSVENQNGLVRQFFPRASDFRELSPDQVASVMATLNNRPRKCLGFYSPAEVLHSS